MDDQESVLIVGVDTDGRMAMHAWCRSETCYLIWPACPGLKLCLSQSLSACLSIMELISLKRHKLQLNVVLTKPVKLVVQLVS